ncbi:MAG TPA: hypothetical protein VF605_07300 [Allosphingosinicella sp.]
MNAPADLDLSGRWTGMFNYPGPFPPVGFEAELRDLGGSITGTVSEPDEDPYGTGGTLHAVVEGSRQGSAVTFSKMYDDAERMPEPVFYSGTIQPDGNEISGRWEIAGQWSGTFLMVRHPGAAEAAEEEAGEEVPMGGSLPAAGSSAV